jgi:hypothetical protein
MATAVGSIIDSTRDSRSFADPARARTALGEEAEHSNRKPAFREGSSTANADKKWPICRDNLVGSGISTDVDKDVEKSCSKKPDFGTCSGLLPP